MIDENIKSKTISSLLWKLSERTASQLVNFIIAIILARLLTPSDYGVLAILLVFIAIGDTFVNAGFGNALIQKKNADDLDFSSVFYCSFIFSIFVYIVFYFGAPTIAYFYDMPLLETTLQVLALRIPIAAINSVQQAYVSRNMQFKKIFYSTLTGVGASAILGITLAYCGFGVWALVVQNLSNALVNTVVLFCVITWRPKLIFSFERLKSLFSYGWKILLSGLIDTSYKSLNTMLIGKFYTSIDLAFFENGKKFPLVIVNNINTSISSVLFPALASEKDEIVKVKKHVRKVLQISSYIMWPMMFCLAVCADNIISIVLTDKWLPAVPYLQIACITYGLWPIHTANLQSINAIGRSDIILKLEIIKKTIGIAVLLISIQYDVLTVALSGIVTGIIGTVINSYPNGYLLKYKYHEQINDMFPSFLISALVAGVVVVINYYFGFNRSLFSLVTNIIIFIILYVIFSKILKIQAFEFLLKEIKNTKF